MWAELQVHTLRIHYLQSFGELKFAVVFSVQKLKVCLKALQRLNKTVLVMLRYC